MRIGVVGLGYVGLPLALSLARKYSVVGYDANPQRIEKLRQGIDENNETLGEDLSRSTLEYSDNPSCLKECGFVIVGVPTPIGDGKKPDLTCLSSASAAVGKNLKKDAIVVFESTVYPGATEEVCVPIIEKESGLKCGTDWKIGYSPERINPGDTEHTIDRITKVVSGMDEDSLAKIDEVYSSITRTFRADSIKVAEAAKVIENTQRDLNIALINELSLIFRKIGIDTFDVLEAAKTKWNFLPFEPGLVGGHCIGVDPYYLTYKAEELGYTPEVILAGRRINDSMYKQVASLLSESLNQKSKPIKGSRIGILGITFKENVNDARNSQVRHIIAELERQGGELLVHDPYFEGKTIFGQNIVPLSEINGLDALVIATPHKEYRELSIDELKARMEEPIIIDVKKILDKDKAVISL
ncbi:MAG: nucleotide sugar dehydrogenase [Candidatus Woesearchaeota archaeon]